MLNVGDILFQLFAILIPVFFIASIVFIIRFSKKKRRQLNRIEEKLEKIEEQIRK